MALWVEATDRVKVYNNTIYGNSDDALYQPNNTNFEYKNNLGYANKSGNVSYNPLFVNASGGDFRLQSGSPAIDAGQNVGLPSAGSAPDLGALEYGGASQTPTPTPSPTSSATPTPTPTSTASPTPTPSGTQLVSSATMTANSQNFDAAHPVTKLWDGCTDDVDACKAGNQGISSYWVEFDFGRSYTLTSARLFGDASGNRTSNSWTLQYKLNQADT